MSRPISNLNELTLDQAKRVKTVVLRRLDEAEHFGGCLAVEVHHALLDAERWIGATIPVYVTLEILEEMRERGLVEKTEGPVITTWKVRDAGD